ncbi:hypothetical protein HDU98_000229 [Podochytrium sp. JEL0797]|nr:hypothetical protein HDU98_000229 [Podochytrium sp. JEL0797]
MTEDLEAQLTSALVVFAQQARHTVRHDDTHWFSPHHVAALPPHVADLALRAGRDATAAALKAACARLVMAIGMPGGMPGTLPGSLGTLPSTLGNAPGNALANAPGNEPGNTDEAPVLPQIAALLDAALRLAAADVDAVDPPTVLLLVEDTSEMLTIKTNERLFDYIEARKQVLTENLEPNKGKALTLLRYCNDLLRRLSKTQHTVFSGRILLFLTGVFSLTERSGVNLKGDFNTDNVTVVVDDLPSDSMMDIDSDPKTAKDNAFYKTFWSLQPYFSDPLIVLKNAQEWLKMQSAVESVLHVFDVENEADQKSGSSADRKRKSGATSSKSSSATSTDATVAVSTMGKGALDSKDEYFFPKFLTSRNLFELQIKDISFRRQIMVQMLIIFQFFMGLTKHASEAAAATTTNKTLQFLAYVLTEQQESWVSQIRARVVRVLEQTTPNGRRFLSTLTTVITHEANWIKWKAESCPGFEKRLSEPLGTKKRFLEHSLAIQKSFSGSKDLDVLKMVESDPSVFLEDPNRKCAVKSLPEFLVPLAEQLEDDGTVAEGVEDEYLCSNDKLFNWRAYRTALGSHFHLFRDVDNIDTKMIVKRMKMEEKGSGDAARIGGVERAGSVMVEREESVEQKS